MTPKDVKNLAIEAHNTRDEGLALVVCEEIATRDLYINVPKETTSGEGRVITTRWADRPCKAGCGQMVRSGVKAWWEPEWGVSHLRCVGRGGLE